LPSVKKSLKRLGKYGSIGLITTAQHLNQLKRIREFLLRNGKIPVEGGQILGCNLENAIKIENKVDCFLYIGSGKFHPLGVAISTGKPVIIANPYSDTSNIISEEDKHRYLKRRKGQIAKSLEARTFGIIVSTKTGQLNLKDALEIKEKLEKMGRRALLFAGSEINPDNLLPFKVNAWINTACPRLIEDHFDKPVLNPDELSLLLGDD
jgi:2-(3-amino-3-carboxypropyl)histidine synthase